MTGDETEPAQHIFIIQSNAVISFELNTADDSDGRKKNPPKKRIRQSLNL